MPWTGPQPYRPDQAAINEMLTSTPQVGSAEFKMSVVILHGKSPRGVKMTLQHARHLIEKGLVPMEDYQAVLYIADGDPNTH